MVLFGIYISMIVFWLAVALVLLIIEALTAGLTTIWFAGGAFVALICSLLDLSIAVQVVAFFVISICLLVFTRKIFVEKLQTGSEKTNVDALIGERAIVETTIPPYGVGQVKVGGQVWSAVCEDPEITVESSLLVIIHAVEGVKLIVVPANEQYF